MNRFLVPLAAVIFGTAALSAVAQDYQRGRSAVQAERSAEDKRGNQGNRGDRSYRGDRGHRAERGNRGGRNEGHQSRRDNSRSVSSSGQRQGLPAAQQRLQRDRVYANDRRSDRQDRRHDRRDARQDRRHDRRDARQDRRHDRRDYRNDRRHDRRDYRNDRRHVRQDRRHDRRYDRRHWRHHDWRRSWRHGWSGHRYRAPSRYYRPHGYYARSWSIGLLLPRAYFAPRYYVNYRDYGLAAPPWGCEWIRVDNDLLLVELDSGEVVDVLYDFYY